VTGPLLSVESLTIADGRGRRVVEDVSLTLREGAALALIGESGSGKTTAALALLGHVRSGLTLVSGRVTVAGTPLLPATPAELRRLRARLIAYVPQDPRTSLCPSLRVGTALEHVLRDRRAVAGALEQVRLPSDRAFRRRYPHELSGGQQQRVALAIALARRPRLVVLDEPTTGLDSVTRAALLDEIGLLRRRDHIAVVLISHDIAMVRDHADEIAVLHGGRIVELGSCRTVLGGPTHEYTRALVTAAARPAPGAPAPPSPAPAAPMLSLNGVVAVHHGPRGEVVAADGVSFDIPSGECVALVGSSGSGKTTIARVVAGLHRPRAGAVRLEGTALAPLASQRPREQRRRLGIVFQNPYDSLNPRYRVAEIVGRPLQLHRIVPITEVGAEVGRLLDRVRVSRRLADRRPSELSGGERQRVAIARALASRPDVLVCDEITSALDASVEAAVLDLLSQLQCGLALTMLFISHDLRVVERVSSRIVVVESGCIVEEGPTSLILSAPSSPAARQLLAAAGVSREPLRAIR
jgi:peptide/nickel transport system ATP-binding protein